MLLATEWGGGPNVKTLCTSYLEAPMPNLFWIRANLTPPPKIAPARWWWWPSLHTLLGVANFYELFPCPRCSGGSSYHVVKIWILYASFHAGNWTRKGTLCVWSGKAHYTQFIVAVAPRGVVASCAYLEREDGRHRQLHSQTITHTVFLCWQKFEAFSSVYAYSDTRILTLMAFLL